MKSCMTKKEATMIMARKKKPVSGRLFAIGPLPAKHRSPPIITTHKIAAKINFVSRNAGCSKGYSVG